MCVQIISSSSKQDRRGWPQKTYDINYSNSRMILFTYLYIYVDLSKGLIKINETTTYADAYLDIKLGHTVFLA